MRREFSVVLNEAAETAFAALDGSDRRLVVKQLEKLRHNPELGQPLGRNLVNYRKMYVAKKRIRVIYCIEPDGKLIVTVIAIGARDAGAVYAVAAAEANQRRRLRLIE